MILTEKEEFVQRSSARDLTQFHESGKHPQNIANATTE